MYENSREIEPPKGYIKHRRISVMLFFISLYLFCANLLLIRFNVIPEERYTFGGLIGFAIFIFNGISLIYVNISKKYYRKQIVSDYNNIRVHSKKEIFFYLIPIIVSMFFIFTTVVVYIGLLGTTYMGIDRFNRPFDPMEQKL